MSTAKQRHRRRRRRRLFWRHRGGTTGRLAIAYGLRPEFVPEKYLRTMPEPMREPSTLEEIAMAGSPLLGWVAP